MLEWLHVILSSSKYMIELMLSSALNFVGMTRGHRDVPILCIASFRSKVNLCFYVKKKIRMYLDTLIKRGKVQLVFLFYCTSLSFSSALPGYVKAPCDDELVPSLSSSVGEYVSGLGEERMSSRDEASMRWSKKKNKCKMQFGVHTAKPVLHEKQTALIWRADGKELSPDVFF